jgi:hypothetical protein
VSALAVVPTNASDIDELGLLDESSLEGLPRRWHKYEREDPGGCTMKNLRARIEFCAKQFDDPFKFLGIVPGTSHIPQGPTQREALRTRQTITIPCQWKDEAGNLQGVTNAQYSNGQLLNRLITALEKEIGHRTGKEAEEYLQREALALVEAFSALDTKLADLEPMIKKVREGFKSKPRDAKILGCVSFKMFCKQHLKRTPRAVRYMLSGGNPTDKRTKRGETVSPVIGMYKRLAPLFGEATDNCLNGLPALLAAIQSGNLTGEERDAIAALDNIICKLLPGFIDAYRAAKKQRKAA